MLISVSFLSLQWLVVYGYYQMIPWDLPSQAVPAVFTWKFAAQAQAAVPSLVALVGQAEKI